jgi:peroxiredoxin Q/BCP
MRNGLLLMWIFLNLLAWLPGRAAADVAVGDPAPDFRLVDQYGKPHSPGDYAGQWLVLYFYPKNDTPGCTTEACNFRDDIFRLRELGAVVLGVSLDSAESHAQFAEKHGLPFSLLSDAEGDVARSYGSLASMGPLQFAKRHTFIIDPQGRLAKIYRDVDPARHSAEVIEDLRLLQSG